MDIFLLILLQIFLIALNAIFACAEIAVISTNQTKLEQMAERGDKRAKRLLKLTAQPARFLATIQVAITLSGFLGSAFAADNFADPLVIWMWGHGVKIPEAVVVILITIVLSFFTLIFGELVPKRLAQRKAEGIALGLSGIIYVIAKAFAPLVWMLTVCTNGILRLFRIDPNADEEVSEEDIQLTVEAATKQGAIEEEEQEMIRNIFAFDDLTAGEIVTHRTDLALLWMEESDEEWENIIVSNRFTLYPVCEESVDNVVGILSAKDYFRLGCEKTREVVLREAVRPAYFVPDGVKADLLFRNMKKERVSLAVVIDEHGGTLGIVTMNDLITCLLGDLSDEETPEEPTLAIEPLEDGSWRVQGSVSLDDLADELKIEIPHEDCDTIGGLALAKLGSIPAEGTGFSVETEELSIEVENVLDRQVESAIVRKILPAENEEANEESGEES
ncbi:MAG: HlyC/CorC family transporter [Clostridia bacterium]|nr:HlyC/CorC family transporter [Clostridia bacterium]